MSKKNGRVQYQEIAQIYLKYCEEQRKIVQEIIESRRVEYITRISKAKYDGRGINLGEGLAALFYTLLPFYENSDFDQERAQNLAHWLINQTVEIDARYAYILATFSCNDVILDSPLFQDIVNTMKNLEPNEKKRRLSPTMLERIAKFRGKFC